MTDTTHSSDLTPECRAVLEKVRAAAESMRPGDITDARGLYGPAAWNLLDSGTKRATGRCISLIVSRGLLPLVADGFDSARHNLYRRI